MRDIKAIIRSKIPREALEYNDLDIWCKRCQKTTQHYGSEVLLQYCAECGFVTSDNLDEVVKQLDLEV